MNNVSVIILYRSKNRASEFLMRPYRQSCQDTILDEILGQFSDFFFFSLFLVFAF